MTEIKGLGYVRVLATDRDRWRKLAFDVPGFAPGFEYTTRSQQFADQRKAEAGQGMSSDFPVSSMLGRHTNDKMVSFHIGVPGGWGIEYGTSAELVAESFYTAEEITADSYWGHEWKWAREMKEAQEAAVSEVAQAEPADVER